MIKNFLDSDQTDSLAEKQSPATSSLLGDINNTVSKNDNDPFAVSDFKITDSFEPKAAAREMDFEPISYKPPTAAEASRITGLAFTAGIAFASSVVFMLILGWIVDTFIGTAPWGTVGGIVLGSIVGFVQFFRLNSQILKKSNTTQPKTFLGLHDKKTDIVLNSDDSEPNADENSKSAL